jgi:hypothetical protein
MWDNNPRSGFILLPQYVLTRPRLNQHASKVGPRGSQRAGRLPLHSALCIPRQPSLVMPASMVETFLSKLLPVRVLTRRRYGYSTWFLYSVSAVE